MIIADWLTVAIRLLDEAGIGTSRLDAMVLLEDCLGIDRSQLLAHPEHKLTSDQVDQLNLLLERRKTHEPLAYIRGKTEFYGREFLIDKRVLEPRPESETMIDLVLSLDIISADIIDVGTGSGAIGITIALELPMATVKLVDIDPQALAVAKQNTQKYSLKLEIIKSDLLPKNTNKMDVILANLPYVPDSYNINRAALSEPRLAIFGGPDGLDLYRKLFSQIRGLKPPQFLLTESLPFQHDNLARIANASGYQLQSEADFIQLFKLTV